MIRARARPATLGARTRPPPSISTWFTLGGQPASCAALGPFCADATWGRLIRAQCASTCGAAAPEAGGCSADASLSPRVGAFARPARGDDLASDVDCGELPLDREHGGEACGAAALGAAALGAAAPRRSALGAAALGAAAVVGAAALGLALVVRRQPRAGRATRAAERTECGECPPDAATPRRSTYAEWPDDEYAEWPIDV